MSVGRVRGFTLLEILVAVLIIGVLVAVALPQYQKAVERSRALEGLSLLTQLQEAHELYYLEHGKYATKFEQLQLGNPLNGHAEFVHGSDITDSKSNSNWSFQLQRNVPIITAGRISGKYRGAAFVYDPRRDGPRRIYCLERTRDLVFTTTLKEGDYCERIMQGRKFSTDLWGRYYEFLMGTTH